jgi:hypothetical protein
VRLAVVTTLFALVQGGCFYTDPLNQRPSIDIEQQGSTVVYRGDTVNLTSKSNDPEGGLVFFQWRAYACKDANVGVGNDGGCDQVPFRTEVLPTFTFDVPHVRSNGEPVQSVLVLLEGTDELGATAKPTQQLIIPLGDHGPTLAVSKAYHRAYVVDEPVNLFAAVGDPDDGINPPPALTWTVFSPMNQPTFDLTDIANVPADPMHPELAQFGKTLVPHGIGDWTVQVVATDLVGTTTMQPIDINVAADRAPCLSQLAPIVPPAGQALPLDQTTLFQVLVVDDDLDVYPPSGDPITGTTTFAWSLLTPGASTRQPLPMATGNRVVLAPENYQLGDILELRVEIQDRIPRPINCADNQPTCGTSTCIQRQTWRVEVR